MTAQEKLYKKISENKHIAVGLDTDIAKIPAHLLHRSDPVLAFNKTIIDNTCEFAASYKLNFAFYEALGLEGVETLRRTIEYIPKDILVIGDAKRGDIGNTSDMYADAAFEHFGVDAVTLHPYMGFDSLAPFLRYRDKISFILALTSNKGAEDFEKLKLEDGSFLYQKVIKNVSSWNENDNCGIVFGATQKEELEMNVDGFDELSVLLPGVGAQGGSLEDVVRIFNKSGKNRFIINVSRSLIYKDNTEKFGNAAKEEIISLNRQVAEIWNS